MEHPGLSAFGFQLFFLGLVALFTKRTTSRLLLRRSHTIGFNRFLRALAIALQMDANILLAIASKAADLSFASFAAPNVFPAEYGVKPPQLHEIPRQMASQIQSLRDTPAGKYVLRLYREQRRIQQFQNPNAR